MFNSIPLTVMKNQQAKRDSRVIASSMAAKFDLKALENHLKKYSLQVSGPKRRKRSKDTPFAYLAITQDHSVSAGYAFLFIHIYC
jgi:hypothetical protein